MIVISCTHEPLSIKQWLVAKQLDKPLGKPLEERSKQPKAILWLIDTNSHRMVFMDD